MTSYMQWGFSILIPILLIPYMLHHLGKEQYGLWVLFSSVISYFSLSNFGFTTSLLRELSKNSTRFRENQYISTTFIFFVFILLVLSVVFCMFYFGIEYFFIINIQLLHIAKISFLLIFLTFLLNFLTNIFSTILFAKGYLHIKNYITILQSLCVAFFTYIVLYLGYSLIAIAFVHFIVASVFLVIYFVITKKYTGFEISKHYFDKSILKNMAFPSFHYFLISVAVVIVFNTDNIIISSFVGVAAVAYYAIANKLVNMVQTVLFKVVDILVPDITKLYEEKKYRKILSLHNRLQVYMIVFALIGYLLLYIWGFDVLKLWVGQKFELEKSIFTLFLLFAFFHAAVHVSGMFMSAMGIHKPNAYMAMAEALLNLLLSLLFVHFWGLYGVALGTFISGMLTTFWFTPYWFYRHMKGIV